MSEAPATFSESWYRVARERLGLRPSVQVQRQSYRGERWIVLRNPFSNQFFRLRPAAYEFVARLSPRRTVEEVWKECLERFPDDAPGQEAVIQLLSQLYHANLLQYEAATDAAQLFKRYEKTRQREVRARLLNIMFARIPLLDPDRFLVRTLPVMKWFIGGAGAVLWLAVVGGALKVVADNFTALRNQAEGVLDPNNLLLLYAGLVISKTLHEFGHAFFCRKFGGEVHTMGILFMIFTPIPYVDATSAWSFRERWKRVLVGLAGVLVEVFVAGLATFVWVNTGQGALHSVAFNMMIVASVSTVVFNLNPLLRFDGYYILSDLVGIPNLSQKALRQLRYWAERFLYGLKQTEPPAGARREAFWLGVFGVTSSVYRVFVFGGILLLVADRFLLIGILMAAVCAVAWVAVPMVRLVIYLASSPQLERQRPRAVAVTAGLAAGLLLFLQFVPLPCHFRAPGIVRGRQWTELHNQTAGRVGRLAAEPGGLVHAGQPLLTLENRELELQLAAARAELTEVDVRLRNALQAAIPNLKPLQALRESKAEKIVQLEADREALTVRAGQDGIWVAPRANELVGRWIVRGAELGILVDSADFEFQAVVSQEDGDRLFASALQGAELRFRGESGHRLRVREVAVVPAEQRNLPSPALGWLAGGPVRTAVDDPRGQRAAEPFFEVRGRIEQPAGATLLHGRSGILRFDLPAEPLLPRWGRALWQLLQRRYQI
ncbi:MAG: biotin/lipoyl-binding protein [Verrucomicrobiales bacterium]|nr:biotin/lipoyl-binding protein [Verrucomicrobiales bacterium]